MAGQSYLSQIMDRTVRAALRMIIDRLDRLELQQQELNETALKTGSPVNAHGQRVSNAADPKEARDVVTLDYLRRFVAKQRRVTTSPHSTRIGGHAPPAPPGPENPPPGPGPGPGPETPPPTFLPNHEQVVIDYAAAHPDQLANSCLANGGTWAFLDGVVDALRRIDQRFGYNAKRGDVNDPSQDALAYYHGPGPAYENGRPVFIVDVIGGHCGGSPTPGWIDVTEQSKVNGVVQGAWISRGRLVNTPTPSGSGRLRQVGTGFQLDGQPFDIVGVTAFSLFFDHAYGGMASAVQTRLTTMRDRSILSPRILVTVNRNVGWSDGQLTGYPVRLDPTEHSNFYTQLDLFARMMRDRSFVPHYVVFGDCADGFETQVIRNAVASSVGQILKAYPCIVEISNEPESTALGREGNNYVAYDPWDEAQRLARVYKGIDTRNPVATAGGYTADQMDRTPADWIAYQSARLTGTDKWEWVVNQIMADAVRANGDPRAVVNGEPMCASGNPDNNQNDVNPVHWWAFGILGQLLKIGVIFHSQQLIASLVSDPAHGDQLDAWLDGRALVSSQQPGSEFAVISGSGFGDLPYTTTSAYALYGRHNGLTGKILFMGLPSGWTPDDDLAAGWTSRLVEQREDAALVSVTRA